MLPEQLPKDRPTLTMNTTDLLNHVLSSPPGHWTISSFFDAMIACEDPDIATLIANALPPDISPEEFIRRRRVTAERENLSHDPSAQSLTIALREYEAIRPFLSTSRFDLLLSCAARRMGFSSRTERHPLNFERVESLIVVAIDQLLVSLEGRQLWEELTLQVVRAGAPISSAFDDDRNYESFFDALSRALYRRTVQHVLLLRERGVAEKSAMLEFIRRGLCGRPDFLRRKRFGWIASRRIGISGDLLLKGILSGASRIDQLVLCIDNFADWLLRPHERDMGDEMLRELAALGCRVIAIISEREFEEHFAGNASILETFTVVKLNEPEIALASKLVSHFARGLESQYNVEIEYEAVCRAVGLSTAYIVHERLPYKAVKVLHAICDDIEFERSENLTTRGLITDQDVVEKISQISGLPAKTISGIGERTDYRTDLELMVTGQEHAVREVSTELSLINAGFVDEGKPASVMMFIGQTGTGKTEMAKAVAKLYSSSRRLKTFTLGNFSEPHSVSGLIGVPAGYVGHDQGGRLINELNSDPYGVFLLDEADKAHPDVMQPFLNLFDEGWIADQRGVKAHANRAIFILTTNVGQKQIADMCRKGKSIEEITSAMKEALSKIRHTKSNRPVFTSEFLARVKRFIVFKSLDAQAMSGICERLVAAMQKEWTIKRRKQLIVCDTLSSKIATEAFTINEKSQGREGGRIIRKLMADFVESPIQAAIAKEPAQYQMATLVTVRYAPSITPDESPVTRPIATRDIHVDFKEDIDATK